jgi:hypothetical protein
MRLAQVVTLGTLWLLLCAWWCALLLAAGFVMGLRWDYLAQSLFAARNNTSSPDASNLLDCILKQLLGTPPYLPLCMLTLALAGILLRWWLVSRRPGGQEFLSRLVLLHTLLGGMLLSSAVLYLLVSVIALSPRQRMDAAVDSLVRHGEIGWKNHLTDP